MSIDEMFTLLDGDRAVPLRANIDGASVRVAPDAVTARAGGRLAVAGDAGAMVEVLFVALDRVLVTPGAIHRHVALVVRRVVVIPHLRVAVHAP